MVSKLKVKQVDLIVEYLETHEHSSLLLAAPAVNFNLPRVRRLHVEMFMVVVDCFLVQLVKKERQQYQVVAEVLAEHLLNVFELGLRA